MTYKAKAVGKYIRYLYDSAFRAAITETLAFPIFHSPVQRQWLSVYIEVL